VRLRGAGTADHPRVYTSVVRPRHLYIHVPFCVRRCSYCDFAVTATRAAPAAAWLDGIERELRQVVEREGIELPLELRTIYVGGGTPSSLGVGALGEMRGRLERFAVWRDEEVEWTAEANPESFDEALARDWRAAGVNRISLGAQTFQERSLRWMGRLHGPEGPARALAAARSAGFENVSIDLIFGLPARLERDWAADLERTLELAPEHISLYGLTAEAATPLGRWVKEGKEALADEDSYAAEYLLAASRLREAGYAHYEVSNFARPGLESRHNVAYWTGAAYLGLGPGAHSYQPPTRWWNVRDWAEYASRLAADGSVRESSEDIGEAEASLERAWLGLRTNAGLRASSPAQERLLAEWRERGWALRVTDGQVHLTPHGWLLLDRLAVEFEAAA
jgi:oxygen-independent coproporphyrinogen-3 oxidase